MATTLTLIINGIDISSRISTYALTRNVSYSRTVTTLDNIEHSSAAIIKPVLSFSLLPMTDAEVSTIYNALVSGNGFVETQYTEPNENAIIQRTMRLNSDLENIFLLDSINGNRYYSGGTIQLRGL